MSEKINRPTIYNKCGGKCGYCGNPISLNSMQVDHIIPKSFYELHIKKGFRIPEFLNHLSMNDVNNYDNLMPACRVCNKWKSAHPLELFREELSEQITRLNKRSANYRIAKMYGMIKEEIKPVVFYFETLTTPKNNS